jgi:hypothetical protein
MTTSPKRSGVSNRQRREKPLLPMPPASYLASLGQFVHVFSQVEAMVAIALWVVADIKFEVAPALLSGVRVDGAIGLLGRVMDAKKMTGPNRESAETALRQLGIINKLRNDILHYGVDMTGGELIVSNKMSAHIPERLREIVISHHILDDMTHDLEKINVHLFAFYTRTIYPEIKIDIPGYAERLRQPWRYRSPRQSSSQDKSQRSRQKQRRQPSPSQE